MLCGFSVFAVADGSQTDSELCPDFDGDGEVNLDDYFLFSEHFNTDEQSENWVDEYDLDRDGDVDYDDFFLFSDNYEKECVFEGWDDDGDGVVNDNDRCPGYDDNIDKDKDGIPDGCDDEIYDIDKDCFGIGNGVQAGGCGLDSYCYAGSCCGDDANEYFVYQKAGTSPYIKDKPSLGKCYIQKTEPEFCLFGDDGRKPYNVESGAICPSGGVASIDNNQYRYENWQIAGSIAGSTWRGAICDAGVWDELCDANKNVCNAGCGAQWKTKSVWMDEGLYCCGDDYSEFFIEGNDGTSTCCSGENYFVEGGKCFEKIHDVVVRDLNSPSGLNAEEDVEIEAEVSNEGDYDENVNVSFYVDEEIEGTKMISLVAGENKKVNFIWRALEGIHVLFVKVFISNDYDESNNEINVEVDVEEEENCHLGELGGWNYCSADCKCSAGEGDCDSDDDCGAGLKCVNDVGGAYGFTSTTDVCVAVDYVSHYEKKCYNSDAWWYDSNNVRKDKYADCEFGCSNGQCVGEESECSIGETKCDGTNYFICVNEEWASQGEVPGKCGVEIEAVCEDSDGGLDYSTAGDAKMKLNGKYKGFKDSCKTSTTTNLGDVLNNVGPGGGAIVYNEYTDYLYEAYCKNGVPSIKVENCDCYNGACID